MHGIGGLRGGEYKICKRGKNEETVLNTFFSLLWEKKKYIKFSGTYCTIISKILRYIFRFWFKVFDKNRHGRQNKYNRYRGIIKNKWSGGTFYCLFLP